MRSARSSRGWPGRWPDLSRGASSPDDIVEVAALAALQAGPIHVLREAFVHGIHHVEGTGSGSGQVEVEGQLIVGNRQELKSRDPGGARPRRAQVPDRFRQTGYIDSSGLGALVSLSKKVREQGGELRLAGLNDDLRSLFELTKLDTLFAIADTPEQALAGF